MAVKPKINNKKLNFMKYKWLYFIVSGTALVISVLSLVFWGLKPSIDFTGGTIIEISSQKFDFSNSEQKTNIQGLVQENEGVEVGSIQTTGDQSYILKLNNIDTAKKQDIFNSLNESYEKVEELSFETVGPVLGKELIRKTAVAIILAAGFIMFYVARRFKDKKYGICAILAMFHDTLILLGVFSLLGHFYGVEIDTLFVTAVLTVLSFSVHDTVVVYDRVREGVRLFPRADYTDLVNKAVAETLVRSVNNSLTIIFMLLSLYLLGGATIRWFVFALLVGTIAGTYSSTFTAAPLLVLWEEIKQKKTNK
jgi:preprotein translocase subunit SecF